MTRALTRPGRPVSPALRDAYVRAQAASLVHRVAAAAYAAHGMTFMAAEALAAADHAARRAERLRPVTP